MMVDNIFLPEICQDTRDLLLSANIDAGVVSRLKIQELVFLGVEGTRIWPDDSGTCASRRGRVNLVYLRPSEYVLLSSSL